MQHRSVLRGPVHPADGWRDLDRDGLGRLLSSGLTPDEVGALFGRTGGMVRLRARAWDLDCRPLRARALGLAARHPGVADQFLAVVDGAPLHLRAEDLSAGSGARCMWRCPECAHEWVASVANRITRGSGCPVCAARVVIRRARARPATTPPLSAVSEDLVVELVRNLSRPDRTADTTPSGSQDRIAWRCRRGHGWETQARQRVKHRTQCPTCLAGLWTSRLEYQVAALVGVATGSDVQVGARRRRVDRKATEDVDLYVVASDLLCDLDPSRWHRAANSAARDLRKLERLAGQRYVRVRPQGLALLPAVGARPEQQVLLDGIDETDAWVWAEAVLRALGMHGSVPTAALPSAEARTAALARAEHEWRQLRAGSRKRDRASEFPSVADQLVEVVGHPGLTATDLAPHGDDRALWLCPQCGHRWEARVANRTVLGTGCPPCSSRRGAARSATPRPGMSFADLHPELVPHFLTDLTSPERTLYDLKPNSTHRCRWRCPHCARLWTATPQTLHRRPGGGCGACGPHRGAASRASAARGDRGRAVRTPGCGPRRGGRPVGGGGHVGRHRRGCGGRAGAPRGRPA